MLGLKSTMKIIDNSGAILVEVIKVLKFKSSVGHGTIGDEVVCVVRKTRPYSATKSNSIAATVAKLRKGDVRRAVIVRTRKEIARPDGRVIAFGDNAGVLLNAKKEMIGTRVNGVIAQEVRNAGWTKIAALATKIV